MNSSEPRLAAPGQGLPFLVHLLSRCYYFPKFCRASTWESASELHKKEADRILALAAPLTADQMQRRVLVHGIRGIEDSSRYWSVAMAMEHLVIVGSQMLDGQVQLTRGKTPDRKADIAAVKPKGVHTDKTVIPVYEAFVKKYLQTIETGLGDRNNPAKYHHPWFGMLSSFQWHCLAAAHTNLHRKQIQAIIAGLETR